MQIKCIHLYHGILTKLIHGESPPNPETQLLNPKLGGNAQKQSLRHLALPLVGTQTWNACELRMKDHHHWHLQLSSALGQRSRIPPTCLIMFCPVTFWMTVAAEALGPELPGELVAGLFAGLAVAGRLVTVSPVCPGPGRCTVAAAVWALTGTVAITV